MAIHSNREQKACLGVMPFLDCLIMWTTYEVTCTSIPFHIPFCINAQDLNSVENLTTSLLSILTVG